MVVKTYRKKPVEVEAFQVNAFDTDTIFQIKSWIDDSSIEVSFCDEDVDGFLESHIEVYTHEGCGIHVIFKAYIGDYIIKGIDGSVYSVSESTFKKLYDEVGVEEKSEIFSNAITW